MTAEALVERILAKGGRIHCTPARMVFVLTNDTSLRDGLIDLGGKYHAQSGARGYKRARDSEGLEWDIWIHMIEVEGDLYQAAGGKLPPLEPDA